MAKKIKNKLILEDMIRSEYYDKIKVKCEKCGHSIIMPRWVDKQLCDYCGKYRFRDKKTEFMYRLKEKMYRNER